MVHCMKVTYQNRPLASDTYKKNLAAQRIVVSKFGSAASTYTDPCDTIFQRLQSIKLLLHVNIVISGFLLLPRWKSFFTSLKEEPTDNVSVSVAYIGGNDKLYALTETNFLRLNPNTLETIGDKTNISIHTPLITATYVLLN